MPPNRKYSDPTGDPKNGLHWLGYINMEHGPLPEIGRDFDRNATQIPMGFCQKCGSFIVYYAKAREAHRRRCG